MKKKSILGVLIALLAIGTVSGALLDVFVSVSQEATVEQSVVFGNGETSKSFEYDTTGGNTVCDEFTLKNRADVPVPTQISPTYSPDSGGITTAYVGGLELTEKNVDFGNEPWTVPSDADTVTVEYTIVGDEFNAEVVEGADDDYVLVYYKDNPDRFDDPGTAIPVDDVSGALPYEDDANRNENNYCETGEYETCHGAKLWYVPEDALDDGNLDWSMVNQFYFETELIQYNGEGKVAIWPGQELPMSACNTFDTGIEAGTYTITTEVAPIQGE